jgi:hypothetical protein
MNRLAGCAAAAIAEALALPLTGCGSNTSGARPAAKAGTAPAALTAASKDFIASVARRDATAACAYFTTRGRAYIVKDLHSSARCSQALAATFKRGASILSFTPVIPAQVTRVQTYGTTVILSYRAVGGHGDAIPWVKTSLGWKVDRTG